MVDDIEKIPPDDPAQASEATSVVEDTVAVADATEASDTTVVAGQAQPSDTQKVPHLGRILSMKVPLIVKIAQKKMTTVEILKLNLGSVIQFEQNAAQQIDLMVNNTTIGLGQTVKIGEKFGLKISQIGDLATTIKALGKEK